MFIFKGKLNGVDSYKRVKVIVDDPTVITKKINDITNPYHSIEDNKLECFLTLLPKHKDYFLEMAESHKNIYVILTVLPKRYSFDGKKGTSLILKSLEVPYI